jgi:hypothetical protein
MQTYLISLPTALIFVPVPSEHQSSSIHYTAKIMSLSECNHTDVLYDWLYYRPQMCHIIQVSNSDHSCNPV